MSLAFMTKYWQHNVFKSKFTYSTMSLLIQTFVKSHIWLKLLPDHQLCCDYTQAGRRMGRIKWRSVLERTLIEHVFMLTLVLRSLGLKASVSVGDLQIQPRFHTKNRTELLHMNEPLHTHLKQSVFELSSDETSESNKTI